MEEEVTRPGENFKRIYEDVKRWFNEVPPGKEVTDEEALAAINKMYPDPEQSVDRRVALCAVHYLRQGTEENMTMIY